MHLKFQTNDDNADNFSFEDERERKANTFQKVSRICQKLFCFLLKIFPKQEDNRKKNE